MTSSGASPGPSSDESSVEGGGFFASAAVRREEVARVLGVARERVAAVEVESGRERFGRTTAFLRVDLADGELRRLVAKRYQGSEGADAHRVCQALRAAGMAPPAASTVPAVHGYLPAERLLVMEHAPGRSWLEHLVGDVGAADEGCRRAADWLLDLHRIEVRSRADGSATAIPRLIRVLEAQPVGGHGSGAAKLVDGHCRELSERLPDLALRLAPWPQRLSSGLSATEGEALRPSHGDFHPGNLLLGPGRATAVDLDGMALREPALDVGSALAQLLAMSDLQGWRGGAAAGARAARAFWRRYHRGTPPAARRRLEERTGLHALATLLGVLHYSFAMETRRRDLGHRWLPGLEAWWKARDGGLAAGIERFAETLT